MSNKLRLFKRLQQRLKKKRMKDIIVTLTDEQLSLIIGKWLNYSISKVGIKIGPPVEVIVEYVENGVVKVEKR